MSLTQQDKKRDIRSKLPWVLVGIVLGILLVLVPPAIWPYEEEPVGMQSFELRSTMVRLGGDDAAGRPFVFLLNTETGEAWTMRASRTPKSRRVRSMGIR